MFELKKIPYFYWTEAFTILSLDICSPFHEPMGLPVARQSELQQLLRTLIIAHERFFSRVPRGIVRAGDAAGDARSMITNHFVSMERNLGREVTEQLYRWATITYSCARDPHRWVVYQLVLGAWAVAMERRGQNTIGFEEPARVLREFQEQTDMKDAEEQIAKARTQALSEWDQKVYELCMFANDEKWVRETNERIDLDWDLRVNEMGLMDEHGDLLEKASEAELPPYLLWTDPLGEVLETIEWHRFQRFWRMLLSWLPEVDVERLYEAANRRSPPTEGPNLHPRQLV